MLWEPPPPPRYCVARSSAPRPKPRGPSRLPWPATAWITNTYLPETWKQPGNEEAIGALRVVAAELRVLLVELTGPVVVRRLSRLAPLRKLGIDFSEESK